MQLAGWPRKTPSQAVTQGLPQQSRLQYGSGLPCEPRIYLGQPGCSVTLPKPSILMSVPCHKPDVLKNPSSNQNCGSLS